MVALFAARGQTPAAPAVLCYRVSDGRNVHVRVTTTDARPRGIEALLSMRRMTAIYGLVCLLAVGGWGHVWARAACTHAAAPAGVAVSDEHACCRAQLKQPVDHCAAAEHHANADAAKHEHGATVESQPRTLNQADQFCAHCMMRAAPATGVTRAQQTMKRVVVVPALAAAQQSATPARVSLAPVEPLQHAPPARVRRHLLSILLI